MQTGQRGLPDRFEPPLVRLRCDECGSAWDAWVTNAGMLQDSRDALCECGVVGRVRVLPRDQADASDEHKQRGLEMWRRRRFEGLGFTEYSAWLLARSDAEPEAVKRMLADGCTLDQALRILL